MASRSRKSITVVTSPHGENTVSPPTPTASKPGVFRFEDHRRTVYSDVPLDPQTINELFKLTDIPEISSTSTEFNVRRLEDGSLHVVDPSQPKGASGSQRRPSRTDATLSPNINSSPPNTSPRGSPRASPRSPRTMFRPKILFYHRHDPHYGFTNFSPHPVVYKGKRYPTSEHLFQSFKVRRFLAVTQRLALIVLCQFHGHRPNLAEHIRTCSERSSVAFSEARRFQPEVRPDWLKINVEKVYSFFFSFEKLAED